MIGLDQDKTRRGRALAEQLKCCKTSEEKLDILDAQSAVQEFLEKQGPVQTFLQGLSADCTVAIKSIVAIGQAPIVLRMPPDAPFERLRELLQQLLVVEQAYDSIGGIVGYHACFLELLGPSSSEAVSYSRAPGIDLREDPSLAEAGLEGMPQLGEIYVVGGAGDRLDLRCEQSGEPLPAGCLPFLGRSLIEGLFRDLEGREALYHARTGQKLVTPVALMCSEEKDNTRRIKEILEAQQYFGRPQDSIKLFKQPLVPVINAEGNWALSDTLQLVTKPGGHGVMWKLAIDSAVFTWFRHSGRQKLLVRQVNNPVAGTDNGILAFCGAGMRCGKAFGFSSCERQVNAAEGMIVLQERSGRYTISNIEYTDFAKAGLEDTPAQEGSSYSQYPANVNMLFADLDAVEDAIAREPLPGKLINLKREAPFIGAFGERRSVKAGRLESMMQSVADELSAQSPDEVPTFLTYNERRKTISVTKNSYQPGGSPRETPVGCFYDVLLNSQELLQDYCGMQLPPLGSEEDYLSSGPGFIAVYHPALGPLYSVIAQKIQGGKLHAGAELQLDIADLQMRDCALAGSLLVQSSDLSASLVLENVTIENAGIDWEKSPSSKAWKLQPTRRECLEIVLGAGSRLEIRNTTLCGAQRIEVPAGETRIL